MKKPIVIGSDHAGFALKEEMKKLLLERGEEILDVGPDKQDPTDYPDCGSRVAEKVSSSSAERGVLICGTGIGMTIVANKYPGVRAALVVNETMAKAAKEHNDANILCLPARIINAGEAKNLLRVWLDAKFEGGRHARRVDKISGLESALWAGPLRSVDPETADAIRKETEREEYTLELIASENFVSEAVLEALGNVMTNKYAEGYPGKRYYGGCEAVDIVEMLAQERAKQLFGADFVNVQPHSGAQANMAVYFAALEPGDTILGMNLSHGGHLTHGSPVNFSGRLYKVVPYGVRKEDHRIDMDEVRSLARQSRPKLIVVGASAYPRAIEFKPFREIADEVGAKVMADIAHPAGLVAVGLHPTPIPYCEYVTTTTHKTLRGPRGGMIMGKAEFEKTLNSRVFPGTQGGPLMHVIAAKAVAFKEALQPDFKDYQNQIVRNARTMARALMDRGYDLISGGTDTHLLLVDLTRTGLTGKDAEEALGKAGITVNKNTIPFETRSPMIASGIRIGTPAATTRGMKEKEMEIIVDFIDRALKNHSDETTLKKVRDQVKDLVSGFPLYRRRLARP